MSNLSFAEIDELVPFPELDSNEDSKKREQKPFANPFTEDVQDGPYFSLFEEILFLHRASQKKIVTARLIGDPIIFEFLIQDDTKSMKYYLDLYRGIYTENKNGFQIERRITAISKSRLTILLCSYLQKKRTPKIFAYLEKEIDKAITLKGCETVLHQTSQPFMLYIAIVQEVVITLERRNLHELEFMKIDTSKSLSRLLYLWNLAAFIASPSEKAQALMSLKNLISDWNRK
jgi:hypothetical protein